ncbi:MAG TPA: calcium-binding protein [Allosphingosinicella sp.]|nr:calcium-binding protein [Allosphingosinicella sp.]
MSSSVAFANFERFVFEGGSGDDTLTGGASNERLYGGGGNDQIDGGSGSDTMAGAAGDDTYFVDNAGDVVTESFGDGLDTVRTSLGAGVDLDARKANAYLLGTNLENLTGTLNSGQGLTGNGTGNVILAGAGDDYLKGAEGNDTLNGAAGSDVMEGGADNDTYVVDNVGDTVTENVNEGTDTVETGLGVGSSQPQRIGNMYQLGANVENLTGTALNQGLEGNALNNVITAGAGTDYVDATDGGNDSVNSGDGRDVIYYGVALTSADSNNGGDEGGDARGDLLVIQGDYTITLGADALVDIEKFRVLKGTNTAFGYTDGGTFDYNITTVDANVAAGGRLVVQGGSLQVGEHLTFNGIAETDGSFQLFGGHDADALIGGAQGDHLLGRSGDDTLTGNGGADRLRGGLGGDTMDGGTGADTFVYAAQGGDEPYSVAALESTGLNYDTIVGFSFAEDKIDLPGTVSSLASVNGGTLNDASFDADLASAVDASLAVNGAVLFTANNGDQSTKTFLVVDADGNGSYQADLDFVIQLLSPVGTAPASPDFFM